MIEWNDVDTFTTTYGTLRKAIAEAVEAERERILLLLDDHYSDGGYGPNDEDGNAVTRWQRFNGDVIALIEGQRK